MGLTKDYSRCGSSPYAVVNSNPDPENFIIVAEVLIGKFLMLDVEYPDCKNFEGRKILVFEGFESSKQILRITNNKLDPHFAENNVSPIARFKPNWNEAVNTLRMMNALSQFKSVDLALKIEIKGVGGSL